QRVVDAAGRSDLRVGLPAPERDGPEGLRLRHPARARARHEAGALARLLVGLRGALARHPAETGSRIPLAPEPELLHRPERAAQGPDRGRGARALEGEREREAAPEAGGGVGGPVAALVDLVE